MQQMITQERIAPKVNQTGLLVTALLIPLAVGILPFFFTQNARLQYFYMNKPALAPPVVLFPFIWILVASTTGLASFFAVRSGALASDKLLGLSYYTLELVLVFVWPLVLFNVSNYLLALVVLMLMWLLSIAAGVNFYMADHKAGFLMIPNVLWVSFAIYLNFGIYRLSRLPVIMPR